MIITIGTSRNNKLGSKLIQWWIGAPYSHVYARWYLSDQEREIVYQASHGMVHFEEFNNFKLSNIIVTEVQIEVDCVQFKLFSQKCIDLAGQPYSVLELVQIFMCNISSGKLKFDDQPGYICSELMADLLISLGYKFDKPTYLINPKDLIDHLNKS